MFEGKQCLLDIRIVHMNQEWLGLYVQDKLSQNPVMDRDKDFKTPFLT